MVWRKLLYPKKIPLMGWLALPASSVLIVGFFAYQSILAAYTPSGYFQKGGRESSLGRNLASVVLNQSTSSFRGMGDNPVETIDLKCLKPGKFRTITSYARQVRITGASCSGSIEKTKTSHSVNSKSKGKGQRNGSLKIKEKDGRAATQEKNSEDLSIQVFNRSNGISATLFSLSRSHWSTDYIYLDPGVNHIQIKMLLSSGENLLTHVEINSLQAEKNKE